MTALLLFAFGFFVAGSFLSDGEARGASAVATPVTPLTSSATAATTNCTFTVGFWKNHSESWLRVPSIALGSVVYDRTQLAAILAAPIRGNGLLQLAHQLIATKLNLLLGAEPPQAIVEAVAQADASIGSLVVPPIGSGSLTTSNVLSLVALLADFNDGMIGPGHCPDSGGVTPSAAPTWGALKTIYR